MAKIIEFCTGLGRTPMVKHPVYEQRGKVIPFISRREVWDEVACATYEELVFEPSGWRKCDGIPYQEALESTPPPTPDERPLMKNLRSPWR